jgi:hypothetical protein
MMKKALAAAAAAVATLLAGSPASAITPLPPGFLSYQIDFSDPTGSGSFGQGLTYPAGGPVNLTQSTPQNTGAASSSVDLPFQISASATAVSQANDQTSTSSATTSITFFLNIPAPTPTVSVNVQALLQSTGVDALEGDASSYASLLIGSLGAPDQHLFDTCPTMFTGCDLPVTLQVNTNITMFSNTLYYVVEQVFAQADAQSDLSTVSVTASASADPHFSINPQYLLNNPGVSLQISPGLEPLLSSVPEPQSWALMALGVGMAGGALRRRTRRAVPA